MVSMMSVIAGNRGSRTRKTRVVQPVQARKPICSPRRWILTVTQLAAFTKGRNLQTKRPFIPVCFCRSAWPSGEDVAAADRGYKACTASALFSACSLPARSYTPSHHPGRDLPSRPSPLDPAVVEDLLSSRATTCLALFSCSQSMHWYNSSAESVLDDKMTAPPSPTSSSSTISSCRSVSP
jgi:hypothetical protein